MGRIHYTGLCYSDYYHVLLIDQVWCLPVLTGEPSSVLANSPWRVRLQEENVVAALSSPFWSKNVKVRHPT